MKSINPANYELLGEVPSSSVDDAKKRVVKAKKFAPIWMKTDISSRLSAVRDFRGKLVACKEELIELQTREVGKPIGESAFEFDDSLAYLDWYIENAEKLLAPKITYEDADSVHTLYHEPIGTVAAIIPWNFPICNWIWAIIPNILAGNTIVLKHSEECPLTSKLIDQIVKRSEIPEGVVEHLYGDGTIGEHLARQNPDLIWFTGSTGVGKRLYRIAADSFKKIFLELGGSAPGIVFPDVDLNAVADTIYTGRFYNCGQVCDGLKRLIVHESIAEELCGKLKEVISGKIVGDPLNEVTDLGPLVAERQQKRIVDQLMNATAQGAVILAGGGIPKEFPGAFFEPTLVTNVTSSMRIWQEETFGPLLPVVTFSSDEEAVALANDTRYGLGAYVFSCDTDRARAVASNLASGMVGVNDVGYSIPHNPFGGYKESGIGREHGPYGLYEICQTKIVSINK